MALPQEIRQQDESKLAAYCAEHVPFRVRDEVRVTYGFLDAVHLESHRDPVEGCGARTDGCASRSDGLYAAVAPGAECGRWPDYPRLGVRRL